MGSGPNRKVPAKDLRVGDMVEGWSGPVKVVEIERIDGSFHITGKRQSDGKKMERRCPPDQVHQVSTA